MALVKRFVSNKNLHIGLSSSLLALAAIGCSNEKATFTSKAAVALLSDRNSDGKTSDIEGNTIYAASDATVDTSAMDSSDAADEEATAEASSLPAAEVSQPGVQAVLSSEKTEAPLPSAGVTPTASTVPTSETDKPKDKATEKSEGKAPEKADEKTAVAQNKDEEVPTSSDQPQQPTVTEEEAKSCAEALGLNPAPNPSDFKFALATKIKKNGKLGNAKNQVLFSDPASEDTKPLFLKVAFKNVNKSSIELLDPNGRYCVDMKVKNMNKFKFRFHCDAKVFFVNLQSKKSKKSETLRVQCK